MSKHAVKTGPCNIDNADIPDPICGITQDGYKASIWRSHGQFQKSYKCGEANGSLAGSSRSPSNVRYTQCQSDISW